MVFFSNVFICHNLNLDAFSLYWIIFVLWTLITIYFQICIWTVVYFFSYIFDHYLSYIIILSIHIDYYFSLLCVHNKIMELFLRFFLSEYVDNWAKYVLILMFEISAVLMLHWLIDWLIDWLNSIKILEWCLFIKIPLCTQCWKQL